MQQTKQIGQSTMCWTLHNVLARRAVSCECLWVISAHAQDAPQALDTGLRHTGKGSARTFALAIANSPYPAYNFRNFAITRIRQDISSFVEIFKSWVYPTVAKFPLGESDVKPKVPSTKYLVASSVSKFPLGESDVKPST